MDTEFRPEEPETLEPEAQGKGEKSRVGDGGVVRESEEAVTIYQLVQREGKLCL